MSENTLDELNVEVLRNKLYKVTVVFSAQAILAGLLLDAMPSVPACPSQRGEACSERACQLPGQEVAERRSQPLLCVARPGGSVKVAMGRWTGNSQHSQGAFCWAELTSVFHAVRVTCPTLQSTDSGQRTEMTSWRVS